MSRRSKKWVPEEGDVIRWKRHKDVYILTRGVGETKFSIISMRYKWRTIRVQSYSENDLKILAEFVCKMPNIEKILNEMDS